MAKISTNPSKTNMTDQASTAFWLPTPLSLCTTTPSQSPLHFEAGTFYIELSSRDEIDEN